ncbi:MAG: YigZ family protein [Methanobacteriaceae archaeon]|nr:YigZ family protein [Methanobacteriaceae archaeon]
MKTINKTYTNELNIKKSEFICRLIPATNEKQAKEIINKISDNFKDATHNCSAYVVTDGEGYDDNGEPSGTAGKPMLNVLKKNEIQNIVAVVTRYFGGIKLGAGGLVRAYSKSVLNTLEIAEIINMEQYHIFQLKFTYNHIKDIDTEIRNQKIRIIKKDYQTDVTYQIALKNITQINTFKEKFQNQINIQSLGEKFLEKQ